MACDGLNVRDIECWCNGVGHFFSPSLVSFLGVEFQKTNQSPGNWGHGVELLEFVFEDSQGPMLKSCATTLKGWRHPLLSAFRCLMLSEVAIYVPSADLTQ
ncbi:hypothetical protein E4U48_004906 [Claviceps purpurea]|nr:hypothetical protein E4U48_004906 [Claviceps purpurea]